MEWRGKGRGGGCDGGGGGERTDGWMDAESPNTLSPTPLHKPPPPEAARPSAVPMVCSSSPSCSLRL